MNKRTILIFFCLVFVSLPLLAPAKHVSAQPHFGQINSPSDLINVVNALRQSNGLSPLTVHPILMQTAQSQANYMASIGTWTHERPGGITYTQQLLALGFPLAGDLSLGGFRAENVMYLSNPMVWNGVPDGWQDADHMNTMLSQNFSHIGAGISQGPNGYFYALDCAKTTSDGNMQGGASSILTSLPGGANAGVSQYMVPVSINTALPNGEVHHKVQYGQSLWSVAIEYHTTIKNIQALNLLGENSVIYQGQDLLVLQAATQPAPPTSTVTAIIPVTATFIPSATIPVPTLEIVTASISPPEAPVATGASSSKLLIGLLIVAALVGAGVAVWLIRDPK